MSARLLPLNQPNAQPVILQRPVQLVGRHPECDIRIDHPRISRRHCCIGLANDRIVIRDLGSRNGVQVNGEVIDEAYLKHGDEVAIGPLLFAIQVPEPPKPVAPKPVRAATPVRPPSVSDSDLIPLDL